VLTPGQQIQVLTDQSPMRHELDTMKERMTSDASVRVWAGSATFLSLGVPVLYLVYAVRAGTMLTSLLSSMPGWLMVDPLPILNEMAEEDEGDTSDEGQEEDKGLHELVEGSAE
jgi:hypothetical protein